MPEGKRRGYRVWPEKMEHLALSDMNRAGETKRAAFLARVKGEMENF